MSRIARFFEGVSEFATKLAKRYGDKADDVAEEAVDQTTRTAPRVSGYSAASGKVLQGTPAPRVRSPQPPPAGSASAPATTTVAASTPITSGGAVAQIGAALLSVTPKSVIVGTGIVGLVYSVGIDNPLKPGNESMLREGVKEFTYWREGGGEPPKQQALKEIADVQAALDSAKLNEAQAGSKLAAPISLSGDDVPPPTTATVSSDASLTGVQFRNNLNDGIASKEEIPLLQEAWKKATGQKSLSDAFSASTKATPEQLQVFAREAEQIFVQSGSSPEVAAAGARALIQQPSGP